MFLVSSVVITLGGLFVLVVGIIYADQPNNGYIPMPSVFSLMTVGAAYLTNAWLVYIPIAIINLIMANKINYYQEAVYTDLPAARKRCGSVGMIVFGYLFNKIALIFIIINFIRTKNNAALDGIEAGQKGLNI